MGVAQRDADIKNTFQTPMPQLRGLKRMNDPGDGGGSTAVDPRLQKLLGIGGAKVGAGMTQEE